MLVVSFVAKSVIKAGIVHQGKWIWAFDSWHLVSQAYGPPNSIEVLGNVSRVGKEKKNKMFCCRNMTKLGVLAIFLEEVCRP